MKKYILLAIICTAFHPLTGQSLPVLKYKTYADDIAEGNDTKRGDYYRDTNNILDKYVGIWRYQEGGTVFILKIRKVPKFLYQMPNTDYYFYKDILLINYKLVKNNVVIIDELNKPLVYKLLDANSYNIYDRFFPNDGMQGRFNDITNKVRVDSSIKKLLTLASEAPKIHFLYSVNANTHRGKPREFYQGMSSIVTVPNNVVLVKIE